MVSKIQEFNKKQLKADLDDIRPGTTVKIYQKIKEGEKIRTQIFEGVVIAQKHGKGATSTITVRKESYNIGVERIFPLHSPHIDKIEVIKKGKIRRGKLYFLRNTAGKKARLKEKVS